MPYRPDKFQSEKGHHQGRGEEANNTEAARKYPWSFIHQKAEATRDFMHLKAEANRDFAHQKTEATREFLNKTEAAREFLHKSEATREFIQKSEATREFLHKSEATREFYDSVHKMRTTAATSLIVDKHQQNSANGKFSGL